MLLEIKNYLSIVLMFLKATYPVDQKIYLENVTDINKYEKLDQYQAIATTPTYTDLFILLVT